jgi:predicted enzyme related to lactoylglutathione lyase
MLNPCKIFVPRRFRLSNASDQSLVASKRVTGVGGIFFKAKDSKKLVAQYEKHLGIKPEQEGSTTAMFQWREEEHPDHFGQTVWAIFPHDTKYFDPGSSPFMINFRVSNLKQVLEQLRKEGVRVDDNIGEYDFGKFGWIMDPEGNRIELWEPTRVSPHP